MRRKRKRIEVHIMKKRGFALFLCLAILTALTLPASAEQQTGFLHPFVKTEGSFLYLAGAPLKGGSVTVSANGQNVDCTVTTVREAGLPVTFYCIVDQSSALSNSQRDQQKRALTAVSSALRPTDTMVLLLMGESLVCGEPLTTPESRQQAIAQACSYQAMSTDLNASLVSAVQQAASQNDGSLSCLLLITDGLDDARVAVSQESLFQTIHSSGLSLCTLSLVDPWAGDYSWYHAKRMEGYSAQSIGGISVIPSRNYNTATCVEDSVGEIVEAILSGSVVQLPLDRLPGSGSSLELEVTWRGDGESITEKRTVDGIPLAAPTKAAQPEPLPADPEPLPTGEPGSQSVTTPEPATEAAAPFTPPDTDSSIGNMILCLVLAGFVLVALLVVLAIVLWRKQRALEQEPESDHMPDRSALVMPDMEEDNDPPSLEVLKSRLEPKKAPPKASPPKEAGAPMVKADATPGCRVRLVPENHPEGVTEFTIGVNESVTLGRSQKSDIVLNETDRALSGLHFELQWDSRTLYLRDRKSTNGTALNGVPLRPEFWMRVEKKAVIQAGSTRYTVLVEKK